MTVVAGAALREIQTMKDKDIVDECVQVLRKMFIEEVCESHLFDHLQYFV